LVEPGGRRLTSARAQLYGRLAQKTNTNQDSQEGPLWRAFLLPGGRNMDHSTRSPTSARNSQRMKRSSAWVAFQAFRVRPVVAPGVCGSSLVQIDLGDALLESGFEPLRSV